jgi:2-oxoglutarate ferredoxin oxidoreductase subunit alpha
MVCPADPMNFITEGQTMSESLFLQGNEACALGAIRAGLKFYGGYPITPSSEVAEVCSVELPKVGGRFIQMEDEIASIATIIGASLAGAKSMTATSGPGFSLMQEALGYAIMAEVPIVVVNVQRGGPSTGHPTGCAQGDLMQSRWGTHGDHPIITLYPESVSEVFYETIRAFNLAERYRQPVIFLMDEILAHMRESLEVRNDIEIVERKTYNTDPKDYRPYEMENDIPKMADFGAGYRFHVTGLFHDETGFPDVSGKRVQGTVDRLHRKIEKNEEDICRSEEIQLSDADIVFLAVGPQARAVKMAVRELRKKGVKAGLFRPITIWPFPEKRFTKVIEKARSLVVVEMNKGQLAGEVRKYKTPNLKIHSITKVDSKMISPEEIISQLEGVC